MGSSRGAQIEGQGCPASISYKTYFDTEEVRVSCEYYIKATSLQAIDRSTRHRHIRTLA